MSFVAAALSNSSFLKEMCTETCINGLTKPPPPKIYELILSSLGFIKCVEHFCGALELAKRQRSEQSRMKYHSEAK